MNKPLKFDDHNIPSDLRLAHKVLKNTGFLPTAIELEKKITRTRKLLDTAKTDSSEKCKIQKKLNYLLTKLNTIKQSKVK